MSGLSTMGSISFGIALVAGRKRVPNPATGKTAFRTGLCMKPLNCVPPQPRDDFMCQTCVHQQASRAALYSLLGTNVSLAGPFPWNMQVRAKGSLNVGYRTDRKSTFCPDPAASTGKEGGIGDRIGDVQCAAPSFAGYRPVLAKSSAGAGTSGGREAVGSAVSRVRPPELIRFRSGDHCA